LCWMRSRSRALGLGFAPESTQLLIAYPRD
jgi:hypothetical protein